MPWWITWHYIWEVVCQRVTAGGTLALTPTRLLRQSSQAPNFLIKAAFSLPSRDKGPLRLLLVRRLLETSAPSLREKIDWCKVGEWSALYDVLLVSEDLRVALVA